MALCSAAGFAWIEAPGFGRCASLASGAAGDFARLGSFAGFACLDPFTGFAGLGPFACVADALGFGAFACFRDGARLRAHAGNS